MTTEEKIKASALKLFYEKGFEGASTREIADEAGVTSALLHYYFRSKENLYNTVMFENLGKMFADILSIVNNAETSLSQKIDLLVDHYSLIFTENPNIPIFFFNKMQDSPVSIFPKVGASPDLFLNSVAYQQMLEQIESKKLNINPYQIVINLLSLVVAPILLRSGLSYMHIWDESKIVELIEERRILIPIWVKEILEIED